MKVKTLLFCICGLLLASCGSKTASGDAATNNGAASTETNSSTKPETSGRYKAGDVLYCYAPSGLILRDKPDQAGSKLASLKLSDEVKVVDENPFQSAFSTKEKCGLEIKGFWVKASFGGKEGYVFDGYLLKLKPKIEISMIDYWTSLSKVKTSTDKAPKSDVNYYSYAKLAWENGVELEESGYEGGSNSTLIVPKDLFSFQDAYLFTMVNLPGDPQSNFSCECDGGKQTLKCYSEDELGTTEISVDAQGNFLIKDSYAD